MYTHTNACILCTGYLFDICSLHMYPNDWKSDICDIDCEHTLPVHVCAHVFLCACIFYTLISYISVNEYRCISIHFFAHTYSSHHINIYIYIHISATVHAYRYCTYMYICWQRRQHLLTTVFLNSWWRRCASWRSRLGCIGSMWVVRWGLWFPIDIICWLVLLLWGVESDIAAVTPN